MGDGLWAMGYALWTMGYGLWALGYTCIQNAYEILRRGFQGGVEDVLKKEMHRKSTNIFAKIDQTTIEN